MTATAARWSTFPSSITLNEVLNGFDRTHALHLLGIAELPFGKDQALAERRRRGVGVVFGGWQVNNAISFYSGTPFTVSSSATSLNAPGNSQVADQVKSDVEILKGIGEGNAWFDPLAFAPVTAARFGTAGFNSMRGPGYANWDLGVFRVWASAAPAGSRSGFETFNLLNTAHFDNPGANVSNLRLNPDGSVQDLNGFAEVSSAYGERIIRLGVRFSF